MKKKDTRKIFFSCFAPLILLLTTVLPAPHPGYSLNLHGITEGGPPIVTPEGVLFRYKDPQKNPRYVMVNGDFNSWEKPILMSRNSYDVFVYFFDRTDRESVVLDAGTYRYRYLVDGAWVPDTANNKKVYDVYGTALSYFDVPQPIIIASRNPVPAGDGAYIFYYKNETAEKVYIVGDFNNWNPYSHPLRKNRSGIWEIDLDLPPGFYAYRFLVDGVFKRDPLGTRIVYDRFDNSYSAFNLPRK